MKPSVPPQVLLPPNLEPFVASLLARVPRMNFMQLCRLFEMHVSDGPGFGMGDTAAHEPVRFRPRPRLGFPAGEMVSVEFDEEQSDVPPSIQTTFLGLYGVDAAMPPHLIDEIVLREEGHQAVEAFLDQFNHRFVTLLYRVWKKYRYPESFRLGGRDVYSKHLLCLAGFGWGDKPERAGLPDARMLALLGLLIQHTRTPEGLAGVIALAVPGVGVRVDEFFPVIMQAGPPQPLTSADGAEVLAGGERRGLGGGYVLGRRLAYRGRAVRVTLRPVDAQQAHSLLPGARYHRELMAFMSLYVGVKADVHFRMEVSSQWMPRPVIGMTPISQAPRLGWTSVLSADEACLITISLGVYQALPMPTPNPYLTQVNRL